MENPFKPGAGHNPPYLAGRDEEQKEFSGLLDQKVILQNMILTGLRGIGKTVLLESFKPLAANKKWLWAGTDCSESASVSEELMALRLLTDVALITSNISLAEIPAHTVGFMVSPEKKDKIFLNFEFLNHVYETTPGLPSDKLKNTLELIWGAVKSSGYQGIVFAYDEAQTLSDHSADRQYPLSLLLDTFQSIQKKGIPFMLVLTGLPTLLTRLVETRTYTERLFRVLVLDKLNDEESNKAILKPLEKSQYKFNPGSVQVVIKESGGYPYFIQFICREVYNVFSQNLMGGELLAVPIDAIIRKLDNDFFAGRWARATDREKELMVLIARSGKTEFSPAEIMQHPNNYGIKPFGAAQINQMLTRLTNNGLIYKNRRGRYTFAVPLLERYILRLKDPLRQA